MAMKIGRFSDGVFTLDQLLTFKTSSRWQYNQDQFRELVILLDRQLPAMMHVEIEPLELSSATSPAYLASLLKLPEQPGLIAPQSRDELHERLFHFEGETDSGVRVLVWKRSMVLGDHVRIATFALQINPQKQNTTEAAAITAAVIDVVKTAKFAPEIMPTDRIAPTVELKQTSVSTVLRFRVPGPWSRGKLEEWTIFDSGDRNLGVFEARFDWFPFSLRPEAERRDRVLFLLNGDHPGIRDAQDWLAFENIDETFSPPELTVTFRRLFFRGEWDILDVWFCYRVVATRAEAPETRDLKALFTREVRQAVIAFPEDDEPGPAQAGG